jgi:hypothetical protein
MRGNRPTQVHCTYLLPPPHRHGLSVPLPAVSRCPTQGPAPMTHSLLTCVANRLQGPSSFPHMHPNIASNSGSLRTSMAAPAHKRRPSPSCLFSHHMYWISVRLPPDRSIASRPLCFLTRCHHDAQKGVASIQGKWAAESSQQVRRALRCQRGSEKSPKASAALG